MKNDKNPKKETNNRDVFDRMFFGNPLLMIIIIIAIIIGSIIFK